MKIDISRENFSAEKNYTSVRQQQGRVFTDADWNEQADIQNHARGMLTHDAIGEDSGVALVPAHTPGFAIEPGLNASGQPDLAISAGRAYVASHTTALHAPTFFTEQNDLPGAMLPQTDGVYLAYLDVWERGVTHREAPAIRDVALGGVDSAARSQLVRQVKLLALAAGENSDAASVPPEWSQLIAATGMKGRLAARTAADGVTTDPCAIGARGGYTGTDNRLYRVEIHTPGPAGTATFKWSRDNGAIVTEWLGQTASNRLSIRANGRDQAMGFASGQWIEIDDEGLELEGRRGTLARIAQATDNELTIDPDTLIHFDPAITELNIDDFARGVRRIRRYDMTDATGQILVPGDGAFIALEYGIEIAFDADPARQYDTGDAWLIPARANNRNIVWPCDTQAPGGATPLFVPPHAIHHSLARLAFLKLEAGAWTVLADARRIFASLAHADLTYAGGDGQSILPDLQLSEPLRVSVRSGPYAVPAARVRFTVTSGGGMLSSLTTPVSSGAIVTVAADANGLAAVHWQTGADRESQSVQAVLLDESGLPLPATMLEFHAHRSDARATDYTPLPVLDPQSNDLMTGVETAQAGLDRLGEIKVNRAGDTITGSLTVDQDVEIKGTLTVRGDVIARDTDHLPGDVLLGDQDEDTITMHGVVKSKHTSGALIIEDSLEIRSPDIADAPLRVVAQIQGVAGRAYRKPITLDYTGGATPLADFQVALTLDTAALLAAGNLRPDAGDLLFVDADESTVLPYWLEGGINTTATKIWVRVPAIAAGATHTIYVYYGNTNATSQSSPTQTFVRVIDDVTAAYPMDAGSGATISDVSGNGLAGTINGATWTTGRLNNALQFDGQNDFVNLGTNPLLYPQGSTSLSAWMKFSGLYGFLFSNWWGPGFRGFHVGVWGDGENGPNATNFGIFVGNDALIDDQIEGPSKYNDNQWHHVVAVYDQQNLQLRLYVDGALVANKTTTVSNLQYGASTASQVRLGASALSNGSWYHFAGVIDELKLYGRALSDADAAALFTNYGYVTLNYPGHELIRRLAATEPLASVGPEESLGVTQQTALFVQSQTGNVGIGTEIPGERLSVAGLIESITGGIKFPDGTIQTTAGGGFGGGGDTLPLGTIMAWHKDLSGTPPLPIGWAECNGQIVNDPASPYNGQALPDLNNAKESWNTNGSFLRGGNTSGEFQDDQFQGHWHNLHDYYDGTSGREYWHQNNNQGNGDRIINPYIRVKDPIADGTNGTPRTGTETRPVNMSVVWIIKIRDTAGTGGSGGGHWSKSGDTIFYNSGKVGVGTSDPNETLTVDGVLSLKEQATLPAATVNHGKIYVRQSGPVSISFDGVDDYVNLSAHVAAFASLTTGTVSFWFRSRTTGANGSTIFRYGSTTQSADTFELGVGGWTSSYSDESLFLRVATNGTELISAYLRRGESFLTDQQWHHVAIAVGAGFNRVFVDGELQTLHYEAGSAGTGGQFFAAPLAKNSFELGRRTPALFLGGDHAKGFLDEFAVFDRPLSETEVQAIHAANRNADLTQDFEGVFSPNLAAYFRATNFDGTLLNDASGNNRHGTMQGAYVTPEYPAALVYKDPQGVETILNGGASLPVGTIIAWHKNLTGTPVLPDGWVECNGQILNDPFSAYNGQTMPDLNHAKESWNSKGSFLRGDTTSGVFENDQIQGHTHGLSGRSTGSPPIGAPYYPDLGLGYQSSEASYTGIGSAANARTGTETRPVNMSVVYIIKVKEAAPNSAPGPLQYAFVYDRKPSGTNSGASTPFTWAVRDLNAIDTNIPGASIAANRFTLPEGTYLIDASAPAYQGSNHRIRLFNVSTGLTALYGSSTFVGFQSDAQTNAELRGIFAVATPTAFEIQHRTSYSPGNNGFGVAMNTDGADEIYTTVQIQRIDAPVPPVADPVQAPDVGFSASGGPHVSSGSPSTLAYTTTLTNEGDAFDGTNFTAPYAGLYNFTVTFVKDTFNHGGTNDDVYVTIAQNTVWKGSAWAGEGGGSRFSATYNVLLKLNAGDVISTIVSSEIGLQRHLLEYNFQGFRV